MSDQKPNKGKSGAKTATPYHAVTIVVRSGSCAAARACTGHRYLSAEAPRLPLKECSAPANCPCTYRHYADRRAGPRRAAERGGLRRGTKPESEQRLARGRRKTD